VNERLEALWQCVTDGGDKCLVHDMAVPLATAKCHDAADDLLIQASFSLSRRR